MNIVSWKHAVDILDNPLNAVAEREAAARYLRQDPDPRAVPRLAQALQDEDFGVRWAASEALGQLGVPALEAVLRALADPDRVGDPRLRESAYTLVVSVCEGTERWAIESGSAGSQNRTRPPGCSASAFLISRFKGLRNSR